MLLFTALSAVLASMADAMEVSLASSGCAGGGVDTGSQIHSAGVVLIQKSAHFRRGRSNDSVLAPVFPDAQSMVLEVTVDRATTMYPNFNLFGGYKHLGHVFTPILSTLSMNKAYEADDKCSPECYVQNYPYLTDAFQGDMTKILEHYERYGKDHGMTCRCMKHWGATCDFQCYLDRYADARFRCGPVALSSCAGVHYLETGIDDGRDCTCPPKPQTALVKPVFSPEQYHNIDVDTPIVILYESDPFQERAANYVNELIESGWAIMVLGVGKQWDSWGEKQRMIRDRISTLHPDQLVVISDARDVMLNPLPESKKAFTAAFKHIEASGTFGNNRAVIFSSEESCCVAAMSTVEPGQLIAADGRRNKYALGNSTFRGDMFVQPWIDFFNNAAKQRGHGDTSFPFLNAGLFTGRAKEIIELIDFVKLEDFEDDQAIFSEAMYRKRESVLLDYDQLLFGNTFWRLCEHGKNGCLERWRPSNDNTYWMSQRTGTAPVFLHTPGHFWECYDTLATKIRTPAFQLTAFAVLENVEGAVLAGKAHKACVEVLEEPACSTAVTWVMSNGLASHKSWYTGLSESSSREEVRRYISVRGETACLCDGDEVISTECGDTMPETCTRQVAWAMESGIDEHPDWYPGLSKASTRKDFQTFFANKRKFSCACGLEADNLQEDEEQAETTVTDVNETEELSAGDETIVDAEASDEDTDATPPVEPVGELAAAKAQAAASEAARVFHIPYSSSPVDHEPHQASGAAQPTTAEKDAAQDAQQDSVPVADVAAAAGAMSAGQAPQVPSSQAGPQVAPQSLNPPTQSVAAVANNSAPWVPMLQEPSSAEPTEGDALVAPETAMPAAQAPEGPSSKAAPQVAPQSVYPPIQSVAAVANNNAPWVPVVQEPSSAEPTETTMHAVQAPEGPSSEAAPQVAPQSVNPPNPSVAAVANSGVPWVPAVQEPNSAEPTEGDALVAPETAMPAVQAPEGPSSQATPQVAPQSVYPPIQSAVAVANNNAPWVP
eukprot:CAMPEP_0117594452 /NCGR_PEP_ID=MMETSP0784-20121206/73210_1 /TAXON_ID=39447 /ORGANISM="" /LENGTH=1004 /DNA_ID=CAMNT_0005396515 /DNA_START=126 /DNA_END=3136 /DNA_ORIENTATION=-